ncbi:class I SAM-dependent methyltransferase [Parvularcula maris]|uniref:Class I SAM-dependent methyltransferase n=1 Tax=Parvularcula maris TaxID=2965077 RepID=A0A9X2RGE1_9PROT|nr:class I SAM-dependent methyltransferase [Parvularcula maris]MCQ8183869.1 class I SAM-dependent methyltransferase [Parvularcula maris]
MEDRSNGWDEAAEEFMHLRSDAGADVVRRWARSLPKGASVLDVACGHGEPLTRVLLEESLDVFAIDASPRMAAAFEARFPDVPIACEPAEDSSFFGKRYGGILAVGLVFLLGEETQRLVLQRLTGALKPQGRLLFSAPEQACQWNDLQTGRVSRSLGFPAYRDILTAEGMDEASQVRDRNDNAYIEAAKL